jgi:hypothetical protein
MVMLLVTETNCPLHFAWRQFGVRVVETVAAVVAPLAFTCDKALKRFGRAKAAKNPMHFYHGWTRMGTD